MSRLYDQKTLLAAGGSPTICFETAHFALFYEDLVLACGFAASRVEAVGRRNVGVLSIVRIIRWIKMSR